MNVLPGFVRGAMPLAAGRRAGGAGHEGVRTEKRKRCRALHEPSFDSRRGWDHQPAPRVTAEYERVLVRHKRDSGKIRFGSVFHSSRAWRRRHGSSGTRCSWTVSASSGTHLRRFIRKRRPQSDVHTNIHHPFSSAADCLLWSPTGTLGPYSPTKPCPRRLTPDKDRSTPCTEHISTSRQHRFLQFHFEPTDHSQFRVRPRGL